MRVTILIDDQLLEQSKQYALAHGTTITAIVEDALREKLTNTHVTERQSCIKLKTVRGLGVNSEINLDDSAALQDLKGR